MVAKSCARDLIERPLQERRSAATSITEVRHGHSSRNDHYRLERAFGAGGMATVLAVALGARRFLKELLGHSELRTTMVFTQVLDRGGMGVQNPADRLSGLCERHLALQQLFADYTARPLLSNCGLGKSCGYFKRWCRL